MRFGDPLDVLQNGLESSNIWNYSAKDGSTYTIGQSTFPYVSLLVVIPPKRLEHRPPSGIAPTYHKCIPPALAHGVAKCIQAGRKRLADGAIDSDERVDQHVDVHPQDGCGVL